MGALGEAGGDVETDVELGATAGTAPSGSAAADADVQVSVVIPVRNGEETLGRQLEALAGQTYTGSWELIIGDNGSTDRTAAVVAEWSTNLGVLRTIDASATPGSSVARNAAAVVAKGDKLLFCDADDVVSPGWLASMAEALDRWPIVTSSLVYVDDEGAEDSRLSHPPKYLGRHPFAIGASLGIRREVFEALGRFDTTFPGSSSTDVELSLRAARAGYDVGFADGAEVLKGRRYDAPSTFHQWFGYGRGGAWIFARHRHLALWPDAIGRQVRTLGWMCTHVTNLTTSEGRLRWVRWTAETAGYTTGWFRFRRTPPA